MAKKARRKVEEAGEPAFEFPVFDSSGFLSHEFEMTIATTIALFVAILLGLLSWALSAVGFPWFAPVLISLGIIAAVPVLLPRLREEATTYTKGDWAGLFLMEIFGWLGFWFLFANIH
ncbi:MAG: hypothetical protein L3K14_08210 [Thermoplasmata archaeon]|nr:hypothetical protein [Thermoplasmata archaeon]